MKFYKYTETNKIHSWDSLMKLAEYAIGLMELNETPEEYLNRRIKNNKLIEVDGFSIEITKKANYKILFFSELLSEHIGMESQIEIIGLNIEVFPFGKYQHDKVKYFKEKLDEYRDKVYKEYGIEI